MNQENNKISGISSTLLSEGKSTRLMKMRKKSASIATPVEAEQTDKLTVLDALDKSTKEEFLKVRQIIDQQLAGVLEKYPVNKQARFFKIRFGMDIDQLKELSIKEIYSVLGVKQNNLSNKERITELDYFGRLLSK
jgi:hypothetical protein